MTRPETRHARLGKAVKNSVLGLWMPSEDIIGKSKKRNGVINSEKLWSSYHKLTTSTDFRTGWEGFLENCNVDKEPMIYQHISDETFTKIVEQLL